MPAIARSIRAMGGGQRPDRLGGGWLAAFALAYALFHHNGTLFGWLDQLPTGGALGLTQWADWTDLLTPYLVLGTAAAALRSGAAGAGTWATFGIGAVAYVEGHGIHLAANSIGNNAPSTLAHFWDEVIGHYVFHVGTALVIAALAITFGHRAGWPAGKMAPLALAVGFTHATNGLEGGTAVLGIATAVGFVLWGWQLRKGAGVALIWAYLPALTVILAYGIAHRGFPQPSST